MFIHFYLYVTFICFAPFFLKYVLCIIKILSFSISFFLLSFLLFIYKVLFLKSIVFLFLIISYFCLVILSVIICKELLLKFTQLGISFSKYFILHSHFLSSSSLQYIAYSSFFLFLPQHLTVL